MELHHITLTADRDSRLPLFADQTAYHEALHRLGRICRGCLVLFAVLAEHVHLVSRQRRPEAGRLAQTVLLGLRPIVATPFAPSHIRAVESRAHMRSLLRYLLEQPRHHGMPGHPALWVGSCLPELAGARHVEGLSLRIAEALPDYRLETALSIVGIPGRHIVPADRPTLQAAGAQRLRSVAAAALGVDERLRGSTPSERLARRAVARLALRVGLARPETAGALDITRKATARLERRPVEFSVLATIARRLVLENTVHGLTLAPLPGTDLPR